MSIVSHAFGRVQLTGEDAKKFNNQVTYGRPKRAAHESVREGVKMSKELAATGVVKLRLPSKG